MNSAYLRILDHYCYFNYEEKLKESLVVALRAATAHLRLPVKSAAWVTTKIAGTVSSFTVIAEALKTHHTVLHMYCIQHTCN